MRIAIDRFVAGGFASRFLYRLFLVLLLLPLIATQPDLARADDNSDAANTAVQIFVAAAQATGLPITDAEAAAVTQIVSCGVANQQNIGDCAKNAAIKVILQQAGVTDPTIAAAVGCVTSNVDPAKCAAQAAGSLLKLPPDVQPALNCMVTGGNVVDCGKKLAEGMLLDKVPPEIQEPAKCALEGGDIKTCATKFITQQVVKNLPPNVQGPAGQIAGCLGAADVPGCIKSQVGNLVGDQINKNLGTNVGGFYSCATQAGANVGQCAATFASAAMPSIPGAPAGTDAAAKAMVACIGAADVGNCMSSSAAVAGSKFVGQNAITKDALDQINAQMATIQKLKPDSGPAPMDASPSANNQATLKNIIMVADGIKTGNWGEVVMGGGSEVAIMASNIILSVFLTPEVAKLLGPAVSAMIHNDEAAAQQALAAIGKGDPVALAQVLFTWYETNLINEPCALLGDTDAVNTVCGDMSKAIQQISTWGGDVAHALLNMGKDVLQWLGVWGTVDTVATAVWNTVKGAVDGILGVFGLGGGDGWKPAADCGSFSPKDYFANNYIACVPAAAQISGSPALNASIGSMNSACEQAFDRCIAPDKRGSVASTCAAMGKSLGDVANQVSAAMGTAADLYTGTIGPAAYVSQLYKEAEDAKFMDSPDFCDANFWDAGKMSLEARSCSAFVNKQFPNATPRPAACSGIANDNGAYAACFHSISQSASAGAGQTKLVGPGSAYCNAQTKWIADHHCRVVTGKPQVFTGSGKDITITPKSWQCDSDSLIKFPAGDRVSIPILVPPKPDTFIKPPWADLRPGAGILSPPVSSSGTSTATNGDPKIPVTFPAPVGGGHGPVVLPPLRPGLPLGAPPMKPPTTAGLPKGGGGSSGVTYANGCSGNSPAAGCPTTKSGKAGDPKNPSPILSALPKGGGGSSGINMVNSNSNTSTTKSGTPKGGGGSSGVSMVNGCSGNSPAAGCPTTKSSTSKSGGSSGVSMINGNSGNAPKLSPAFKDTPRTAPIISARPPVSSSGTNAAMDRLGGGSIGGVSGGGGAARRPGTSFGTGSNTFKTITVPPPRNDPNDLHVR